MSRHRGETDEISRIWSLWATYDTLTGKFTSCDGVRVCVLVQAAETVAAAKNSQEPSTLAACNTTAPRTISGATQTDKGGGDS